jgi:hypothetical protein
MPLYFKDLKPILDACFCNHVFLDFCNISKKYIKTHIGRLGKYTPFRKKYLIGNSLI